MKIYDQSGYIWLFGLTYEEAEIWVRRLSKKHPEYSFFFKRT